MARPKGALGKNKAFLLNRLKDMYGKDFDPVMKMAEQAATLDQLALEDPSVTNQKESIHASYFGSRCRGRGRKYAYK